MVVVAERYSSQIKRIKYNVEKSYLYFKSNYDRFNRFRDFVFNTSLDGESIALLKTLKKPQIEFNILEAYISRLRGEFSKQEPSILVMAGDEGKVQPEVIDIAQGHIKYVLDDANKDGFEYQVYTDVLSGGFSVGKVYTKYSRPKAMDQVIAIERVYDPVLCGFDPLARLPHKGDGNYCFELFPMLKEDFEHMHPEIDTSQLKFNREIEGFNWSYKNAKDDILLLADYYEKKKRRLKLLLIAGNQVMTQDEYNKLLEDWQDSGRIEVPPAIVKERWTEIDMIVRFQFIEDRVIEYEETDFTMLPLIFFDGNSIIIRHNKDHSVEQMCRPYVYNAIGMQKLKNFAGQTLGNELENMIQHKFVVAKESLPLEEEYLQPYRDVQQADVLIYNYNNELQPDKPLPAPQPIQRIPIPPEVHNTFLSADQMTQTILGNFDMDLGKLNKQQVSGIAMIESVTQSNSAAMPYVVGYMQGLSRIAEIVLDLIPKYFATPRTMPIVKADGKRDYVKINQRDGVDMKYEQNALNVRVEAGVNFSVQKSRAMAQVVALMQASPLFAQFVNTEGLDILLDNVEIKGIDQIKEKATEWMKQMKQMQQQQQQQASQMPNPAMMKMQIEQGKLQQASQKMSIDAQMQQMESQLKAFETRMKAQEAQIHAQVQVKKANTELESHRIDAHLKIKDQEHRHLKEAIELHHNINQEKTNENKET